MRIVPGSPGSTGSWGSRGFRKSQAARCSSHPLALERYHGDHGYSRAMSPSSSGMSASISIRGSLFSIVEPLAVGAGGGLREFIEMFLVFSFLVDRTRHVNKRGSDNSVAISPFSPSLASASSSHLRHSVTSRRNLIASPRSTGWGEITTKPSSSARSSGRQVRMSRSCERSPPSLRTAWRHRSGRQGFVKVAGGVQPGESPVRSRNCRAWRGSWAQWRVSAV